MMPAPTPWHGRPVAASGLYAGMPLADYHRADIAVAPSVSSTGLRVIFHDSPAHYWASSPLNPERIDREDTSALTLGRAAHHLLLGEADFARHFAVRPERWDSWRSRDAQAWRAEQAAAGRTPLLPVHIAAITGMAKALAAHPLVRAGILSGGIEQSLFWSDPETGIWQKSRPDAMPGASGDFADLKTCVSVKTEALERTIAEYGYQMQAALLADGALAVTAAAMASFTLVFVEKTPPHCVRIVTLKDADLDRGRKQNRAALTLFARCLKENRWPGPGRHDAEYLGIPSWHAKKIDDALLTIAADYS